MVFVLDAVFLNAAAKDFTPTGAGLDPVCEPDPKPTCVFRNLHAHTVVTVKPSCFATVDNTPKNAEI